jgi:hypothetical protein
MDRTLLKKKQLHDSALNNSIGVIRKDRSNACYTPRIHRSKQAAVMTWIVRCQGYTVLDMTNQSEISDSPPLYDERKSIEGSLILNQLLPDYRTQLLLVQQKSKVTDPIPPSAPLPNPCSPQSDILFHNTCQHNTPHVYALPHIHPLVPFVSTRIDSLPAKEKTRTIV